MMLTVGTLGVQWFGFIWEIYLRYVQNKKREKYLSKL
jgi:hypothetical protein